ncbi:MAG: hypothetical protein ACPGXX_00420, partial [Planctomycetaceae bacterium]
LEAEFQIRTAEAEKWKEEEKKLGAQNEHLERELKDATAAIQEATKEVRHCMAYGSVSWQSFRQGGLSAVAAGL